ncbi:PilZ domain protein [Mariprofundus micogutta]|uniref:PilZ domain protein n=1 Tax=Mariprofundus micogutta TaxID=1921010 RepID=A0A1L8CN28_9PROT|nr:PilZ domain-containing protein [Mariprofundus micogutta]GAV20320.1 PilZ domain protein [Mariprofundus micogutta]
MQNERRNGDRYCFHLDLQPKGELTLFVDGRILSVWKLVDISPFGTGLSIHESLDAGSNVSLQYLDDNGEIQVSGTVAWSDLENSQEEGEGYRVGIQFSRKTMSLNVAIFKAVTDFPTDYHRCAA